MDRAASVAGSCIARGADVPSRADLVRATRGCRNLEQAGWVDATPPSRSYTHWKAAGAPLLLYCVSFSTMPSYLIHPALQPRRCAPFVCSAKGALQSQPGATPQGSDGLGNPALKARFTRLQVDSRFQRSCLGRSDFPEALPQAAIDIAPLALNRRAPCSDATS